MDKVLKTIKPFFMFIFIINIFSDIYVHNVFLDRKLRDELNKGLKTIQANGLYGKIMKKYKQDLRVQEKVIWER